jgi:DNA polymerase III epsilon subunit-like protein
MNLLIDIETTGFSVKKHSIIEIGWAFADDAFQIVAERQIYILPQEGKEISQEAVDINGYDEELWIKQGAKTLPEAQEMLKRSIEVEVECLGQKPMPAYAHNARAFDKVWVDHHFPFMTTFISEWRCSMSIFKDYHAAASIPVVASVRDPETKRVITPGTLTLAGICKTAGTSYRGAHGALEDCRSMAGALAWLKATGPVV